MDFNDSQSQEHTNSIDENAAGNVPAADPIFGRDTTSSAAIQVYASFPDTVTLGSELDLDPSNWHWVHCLTLPLNALDELQLSRRPYKWIRYAVGVVVGVEGDLSFRSDPVSLGGVDYDQTSLPSESVVLYYHTCDEQRWKMFPMDPMGGRTHKTTLSDASTRMDIFCDEVKQRDGNVCALSGVDPVICTAAHLLPHTKGDSYIATYCQRRSRDPAGGDIIRDIDDVRNGLFVDSHIHATMGRDVAFLMTPNFALNTDDVDLAADPAERRGTAHLFEPDKPYYLGGVAPPPRSLRISGSPSEWPPDILFDAVYAGAVLHHFGTQKVKDKISGTWNETFYEEQPQAELEVSDADAEAKRGIEAKTRREYYRERRAKPDMFDVLMAIPYMLVPKDQLQSQLREAREKKEERERRRVWEKVNAWMKQSVAE